MSFIKDLLGSSSVTLRHFAIDDFTLDVVTEETHQFSVTSTESAVESGARITDHRVINPQEVMIRGVVVNYESKSQVDEMFPQTTALLENIPLPIQVSAITDQIKSAIGRASSVINRSKTIMNVAGIRPSFMNDLSQSDDRISKFKTTLEQIAMTEDTIEVMTSTGLYANMQISSVSVVRGNHGSAEFQIYLKEILTYDVETVGGINAKVIEKTKESDKKAEKPMGEKKSDRPQQQAAKPQNKGKTAPQKSKKSAIKTIFDSAGFNS